MARTDAAHPNVARVIEAAARAGLAIDVTRFPTSTRTAADAARAVGCEIAQIVKSLVFMADGSPVLVLASGVNRVDAAKVAAALGASAVRRADGDEARRATGYAIGGVPPIGHAKRLRVLMDEDLTRQPTLWAAAGLPDAVFEIAPADLLAASRARLADVAERPAVGVTDVTDAPAEARSASSRGRR